MCLATLSTSTLNIGLIVGGVIAVIAVIAAGIYFILKHCIKQTGDSAIQVADGLSRVAKDLFNFTPLITINSVTHCHATTGIMELATGRKEITRSDSVKNTWLFSTKELVYEQTYIVKAGFDLNQPFKIEITKNPLRAVVTVGAPVILSIEPKENSLRVLKDESGWWNTSNNDDRVQLLANMLTGVRAEAQASDLLPNAKKLLEEKMREAALAKGSEISFSYLPRAINAVRSLVE